MDLTLDPVGCKNVLFVLSPIPLILAPLKWLQLPRMQNPCGFSLCSLADFLLASSLRFLSLPIPRLPALPVGLPRICSPFLECHSPGFFFDAVAVVPENVLRRHGQVGQLCMRMRVQQRAFSGTYFDSALVQISSSLEFEDDFGSASAPEAAMRLHSLSAHPLFITEVPPLIQRKLTYASFASYPSRFLKQADHFIA